jgi:hypothetical protein
MPTYHVVPGGAGTHSGADKTNAYSMEEACDNVVAGDLVHVYGDSGDYTAEYDTGGAKDCVLYVATSGSAGSPVVWQGCYSTPGDGGIAVIDADPNTLAYGVSGPASFSYQVFKNIQVENATLDGFGNTFDFCTFKHCRATNNSSDGFFGDDANKFLCCSADGNDATGITTDTYGHVVACVVYGNGTVGIGTDHYSVALFNLCYQNGNGNNVSSGGLFVVVGNTIDGENQAAAVGIYSSHASYSATFVNNIVYDLNVGISQGTDHKESAIGARNLFNSNNDDSLNFLEPSTGNGVGNRGDVTGAPAFTDEAGNDYTLGAASPALTAGLDASFTDAFWDSFIAANNPPSP